MDNVIVYSDDIWYSNKEKPSDDKLELIEQKRLKILNELQGFDENIIQNFYLDVLSGGNPELLIFEYFKNELNNIVNKIKFKAIDKDKGRFCLNINFEIDGVEASTPVWFVLPSAIKKEGLTELI